MIAARVPPRVALRRWYTLGQRHRRMAERLRRSGYLDGAVFHAYHAYECVISAFIAAGGVPVPPGHQRRLDFFASLIDSTRPYATAYSQLGYFTPRVRNEALYYDESQDIFPADRYGRPYVEQLLPDVHRFAREVWREIG